MSRSRFSPSLFVASVALVLAVAGLAVASMGPTSGSTRSPGTLYRLDRSAPSSRAYELASAFTASGAGTPYFERKAIKPVKGLFTVISFKNSGILRGVCTSSLVGLQYKNTTTHDVDIWSDNLDATSGGYSGGPWSPGGTGGEAYTGAITWFVQVATGSGSSAQYASFIVSGFHDGPDHGCNLQIQGTATMGLKTF